MFHLKNIVGQSSYLTILSKIYIKLLKNHENATTLYNVHRNRMMGLFIFGSLDCCVI